MVQCCPCPRVLEAVDGPLASNGYSCPQIVQPNLEKQRLLVTPDTDQTHSMTKPSFAVLVCRGHQVLHVRSDGSTEQHVPGQLGLNWMWEPKCLELTSKWMARRMAWPAWTPLKNHEIRRPSRGCSHVFTPLPHQGMSLSLEGFVVLLRDSSVWVNHFRGMFLPRPPGSSALQDNQLRTQYPDWLVREEDVHEQTDDAR